MEAKINRESNMFGRALTFWTTNSADIPAGSKGAGYCAKLNSDQQSLVAAGATQKGGKVTAQNALFLILEKTLQNIARTAHAIAQDVPGFDDLFAPPEHYNPTEVLATANIFLAQLAPAAGDDAATTAAKTARVTEFVAHNLAATFVADLQAQVTAIGAAKDTHETGREKGVFSTSATAQLARDGKKQVVYLNAIAQNLYSGQPEQLSAWASASHIERDPSHPSAPPAPAVPPAI